MVTRLPYIGINSVINYTPYEFPEVVNACEYRGAVTRNKFVMSIDILSGMTKIFSEETLNKYRALIYSVISGKLQDVEKISTIFNILYREDRTFRIFLGEIVYFDESIYEKSLFHVALERMHETYFDSRDYVCVKLEERGYKIILETEMQILFAVSMLANTVRLPEGYKGEILSNAKIWTGNITRE